VSLSLCSDHLHWYDGKMERWKKKLLYKITYSYSGTAFCHGSNFFFYGICAALITRDNHYAASLRTESTYHYLVNVPCGSRAMVEDQLEAMASSSRGSGRGGRP